MLAANAVSVKQTYQQAKGQRTDRREIGGVKQDLDHARLAILARP
jgi:hypothetical protein